VEYYKRQENVSKPKKYDEQICGHYLPMHMGSGRSDEAAELHCSAPFYLPLFSFSTLNPTNMTYLILQI
jgi:hypothetical protein